MDRRTTWTIVAVVLGAGLLCVGLPLLGVAIFFRHEIGNWVFGPRVLTSGVRLVYEWKAADEANPPDLEQMKGVILRRIDPDGGLGCEVTLLGERQLEVKVPADDVERVKRLLARVGHLEFRVMADRLKDHGSADFDQLVRQKQAGQTLDSAAWRWVRLKKGWDYYTNPPAKGGNLLEEWNYVYVVDKDKQEVDVLVKVDDGQNVTGRDLASVFVTTGEGGERVGEFMLTPDATVRFGKLTNTANIHRHLAIILDGEVQSAPVLLATLGATGIITGCKDRSELEEIVSVLNSGELGVCLGDPVREERFGRP